MPQDRIMSLQEVSAALNRDPKTIWRWWAKEKRFPKPIQFNGRCLGWKASVFQAWLEEQGVD
ncbi:AlpA family phage regulatory protein [Grimontia kaedaensis]|uniref:Prophage CP4-57 regulatory protein (AlpA) n=2 Tax=Grimontia TaxID=246861 RepID=A0A128FAL5_9GAMM|nr:MULTISPECIES: AlpA family phage regulatory protein [Grimontia]USH02124.1 AlpA family phage regulatory protein [Grimontia kaedaensis]CZF83356.1 hypothetical protein GMA8713_02624 [Grimontia marina]